MGQTIAKVIVFLMFTCAAWVLLVLAAQPIAHQLLPCDVDQTTEEPCSIDDYPSNYELRSEDGSVIGDFNTWHAVLYVLGHDENVSLETTPRELDMLAFGSLYGLAFFITLLAFSLFFGLRGAKTTGGSAPSIPVLRPEETAAQTRHTLCARCRAMVPASSRFCYKCGSALAILGRQAR